MIQEQKQSDEIDLKIHLKNETMIVKLHSCTQIEEICTFISKQCNIPNHKQHTIIARKFRTNQIISNDTIVLDLKDSDNSQMVDIEVIWDDDDHDAQENVPNFGQKNMVISERLLRKLYECILMKDFQELRKLRKHEQISNNIFSQTIILINSLGNSVNIQNIDVRKHSIEIEKEMEEKQDQKVQVSKLLKKLAEKEELNSKLQLKLAQAQQLNSKLKKKLAQEEELKRENQKIMMSDVLKMSVHETNTQQMKQQHELKMIELASQHSFQVQQLQMRIKQKEQADVLMLQIQQQRQDLKSEIKNIQNIIQLLLNKQTFRKQNKQKEIHQKIGTISQFDNQCLKQICQCLKDYYLLANYSIMMNIATFRKFKKAEIWQNLNNMIEKQTESEIEQIICEYYDYQAKNNTRDFIKVLKQNQKHPFVVLFTTEEEIFGLFSQDFMKRQYNFKPKGFLFDLINNLKIQTKPESFLWKDRPINFKFGGEAFNIIQTQRLTPLRLKKSKQNYCNLNVQYQQGFNLSFGGDKTEVELKALQILTIKLKKQPK